MNFVGPDRIKNEIAQTGSDYHTRVRFVRCTSLVRVITQQPCALDKLSDNARGNYRALLTDVSVNSSKIALGNSRKANFHTWCWR